MVKWPGRQKQTRKQKEGYAGLSAPLLPGGETTSEGGGGNNNGPRCPSSPADEEACYYRPGRRSTTTKNRRSSVASAAKRRRRLSRIRAHEDAERDLTMTPTEHYLLSQDRCSAASSDCYDYDNDRSCERPSIARTESELTDYGANDSSTCDLEAEVPREKLSPGAATKTAGVALLTVAGVALYAASFVVLPATAVYSTQALVSVGVAGGWSILVSTPLVWLNEWRLSHLPALRNRVNDLRQLAGRFRKEIDLLRLIEYDLREDVTTLREESDELESVVKKNGGNVDDFVSLVRQNQMILSQMKENMRGVVLQEVVRLVLQSDIDRDGVISKREANILAKRLSLSLDIYGIVFDEVKFHRAVGLSPSIAGVMTIVRRLLPDAQDRTSSFYSDHSEEDSDYEDDDDDDGAAEEEDDVYDMFYVPVEGRLDRGDADTIFLCREYVARRGERPTLISVAPSRRKSVKGLRSSVSCDE